MADMKSRVNIPGGLRKALPSASVIASVNQSPPGDSAGPGLVLHSLIDFYCGMYFILCSKETEPVQAACSAEKGKEFVGDGIRTVPCSWLKRK